MQRAFVTDDVGDSHQRTGVPAVDVQGVLIGTLRVRGIVFFQKQIPPQHVGFEVIRIGSGGLIEQAIGIMKAVQQPTRQSHHGHIFGGEDEAIVISLYGPIQHLVCGISLANKFQQRSILNQAANRRLEQFIHKLTQYFQGFRGQTNRSLHFRQLRADQGLGCIITVFNSRLADTDRFDVVAHHRVSLARPHYALVTIQPICHLEDIAGCCIGTGQH